LSSAAMAVQAVARLEELDPRGATMWELDRVDTRVLHMLTRSGALVAE